MKKPSHSITLTKKGSLCALLNSTRPESPVMTLLNLEAMKIAILKIEKEGQDRRAILTVDGQNTNLGPLDPDSASEQISFLAKNIVARNKGLSIKKWILGPLLVLTLLITGSLIILNPDQVPSTNTATREAPTGDVPPGRPGPVPAEDWLRQQQ